MTAVTTIHAMDDSHNEAQVKRIWKAFWILLLLTIVELGLGLSVYYIDLQPDPSEMLILFIKGVICILTFAKAFYIISIFITATLFIWFIFTFLYEGNSYKNLQNTDAGSRPYIEKVQQHPVPAM